MSALRPEYDTVRDHLQAAIAEGKKGLPIPNRRRVRNHKQVNRPTCSRCPRPLMGRPTVTRSAPPSWPTTSVWHRGRLVRPHRLRRPPRTLSLCSTPCLPASRSIWPKRFWRARATTTLSQKRLAEQVGLDPSYLSMAEGGKRVPKIEALILIAEALNMNLSTLITLGKDRLRHERRRATRSAPCERDDDRYPRVATPFGDWNPGSCGGRAAAGSCQMRSAATRTATSSGSSMTGRCCLGRSCSRSGSAPAGTSGPPNSGFTRASTVTRPLYTAATPPPSSMRGSSGTLRGSVRYTKRPRPTQERHDDPIDYEPPRPFKPYGSLRTRHRFPCVSPTRRRSVRAWDWRARASVTALTPELG